ncbi:PAS domain-containing protein [Marivirga harenae]|uniref:PAS domain-containing protein n=1 Tax=Marivirga harenae TaxID=2010992 RepID=UPI0026E08EF2|nr:PAS domain-containing protein [Marivirga harenae]WKV12002.1 PAS domain-containing protein [Marivirga harenae]
MNTAKIPLIVLAISFNSNKALKSYLQKINLKSGYAYIIIQEQEKTTGALINELSEISDHIPIRTIKEGMSLERGKVYINSEKTIYTISSNRFSSKNNFRDSNLTEMISYFINSLADENKEGLAIIFFTDQGQVGQALETVTEPVKQLFFENQNYRLLSIAEQTKNSIITTDIEGKITYVNDSFLRLTGYDADFVLGKKPGHFLQGEETDSATVKIMSDALANGKGFEVDIVNYTKAGEKYWTNINCEPLLDANNKINGFFSFQYVISQQKEYEEKIESLNEILQSRNKKLTELNKSLEEFAYVASHDLKEPARNIKSLLELILKKSNGQLNHNTEKYINMAIKSGDKMYQLINSLLEFSRSGILNENLQTIKVKDVMGEVKFSLGP